MRIRALSGDASLGRRARFALVATAILFASGCGGYVFRTSDQPLPDKEFLVVLGSYPAGWSAPYSSRKGGGSSVGRWATVSYKGRVPVRDLAIGERAKLEIGARGFCDSYARVGLLGPRSSDYATTGTLRLRKIAEDRLAVSLELGKLEVERGRRTELTLGPCGPGSYTKIYRVERDPTGVEELAILKRVARDMGGALYRMPGAQND